MALSPILKIPLLATSQAAKETTVNTMVAYLERAMNDAVDIDLQNGSLALTETDFNRYMMFSMQNVAVGSTLTVPATKRLFVVDNRGNVNPLTVSIGPDSKEVARDALVIFHSSPTRLTYVSNSAWTGYDDAMPSEEPNGKHTFWRVKFLTGKSSNSAVVGDLIMRDTLTGDQLATGGTAIGSGGTLANAFDNTLTTFWQSQSENLSNGNTWIGYQFAQPVAITNLEIKQAVPGSTDRRPQSGVVEFSDDGLTWYESWAFSGLVWAASTADTKRLVHPRYQKVYDSLGDLEDTDFLAQPPQEGMVLTYNSVTQKWEPKAATDSDDSLTHRFWRIFVLESNDGNNTYIHNLEFRNIAGVPQQATGGVAIRGGSSGTAANAFDGDDATFMALNPHENNYIGYDFLSPVTVREVAIRIGSVASRSPKVFRIEWSDNGTSWNVAGLETKTDWVADETYLVTPTSNFQELPDGGAQGQLLAKNSSADGDVAWVDAPVSLPAGGTEGQVLQRDVNGEAIWGDVEAGGLGAGYRGAWGGVVPITFEDGVIPAKFVFDAPGAAIVNESDPSALSTKSLRFRSIPDNGLTYFFFTETFPEDGTYTVRYRTSGEAPDRFIVSLDGVEQFNDGGVTNTYKQATFAVTAGSHTLRFAYDKDGSIAQGDDTIFISQLTFTSATARPYEAGDTVDYQDDLWMCVITGTTDEPGATEAWRNLTSGGGSASYPDFVGNAGRVLAVNADETGVEWVTMTGGAPSSLHAANQWRILIETNGGDARTGLGELEMRVLPGGDNVATGGTPEVSSSFMGDAAAVFDGDTANTWLAADVADEWVSYTFDQAVTIREVALTTVAEEGFGAATAPKNFKVQYFDPETFSWADEWTVTDATFTGDSETQVFANPAPVYNFETIQAVVKTEDATLTLSDIGKIVRFKNLAPATFTIPTQAAAAIPVGTLIDVLADSDQDLTFAAQDGVTLNYSGGLSISGPAVKVTLLKVGTNEWDVIKSGGAGGGEVPDGGTLSFRFWRLAVYENNGDSAYLAMAGLDFLDEDGASLRTGGSAFASNSSSDGNKQPANAFGPWTSDSDYYWTTQANPVYPIYIGWEFPEAVSVRGMTMTGVRLAERNAKVFWIECSNDGVEYTTVEKFGPETNWALGGTDTRSFVVPAVVQDNTIPMMFGNEGKVLAVNATATGFEFIDGGAGGASYPSFTGNAGKQLTVNTTEDGVVWATVGGFTELHTEWRVLFLANGGDSRVGISEMEMRQDPEGPDECVGGTVTVSSSFAGNAATTVDGDLTNYWLADSATNEWVAYAFANPVEINEVMLASTSQPAYAVACGPRDFDVQYKSESTGEWTTYFAVRDNTYTAYSEPKVFTNENYSSGNNGRLRDASDVNLDGLLDGDTLRYNSASGKWIPYKLQKEFATFLGGNTQAGELVFRHAVTKSFVLPVGLLGSVINAGTAASAETVFTIKRNDAVIGTVTFVAGSTVGAVSFATAVVFASGDIFQIVAPTTPDQALADISFSIIAS
ncbi:hypothetical protein HNR26_003881 [Rhizobium rosettiformans]|uniref:F5/8 type C domain-containing protein n=2 Tax=Rhizobium rosettiformans TaxID=1368430 RepID=A0A4S8PPJ9_9HYPH|nr:hypothetical protein [Rhizobium rosettiformans]MBB5277792.1 hypothetical protein [Rhizobium rosettiformans]THV32953.1 hypothetical protein FAA86_18860 [Rhizobium rosettiformans W3]